MKKTLLTASLAALTTSGAMAQETKTEKDLVLHPYDKSKEVAGPSDYFVGDVTVGEVFKSGDNFNDYAHATVTFQPSARTAWHTHPRGQTLVILSGEGRAQAEGENIKVLKPGDVVWIPAHVRHWHGAAPNISMSHLAIQAPNEDGDVVDWQENVTDTDYLGQ